MRLEDHELAPVDLERTIDEVFDKFSRDKAGQSESRTVITDITYVGRRLRSSGHRVTEETLLTWKLKLDSGMYVLTARGKIACFMLVIRDNHGRLVSKGSDMVSGWVELDADKVPRRDIPKLIVALRDA